MDLESKYETAITDGLGSLANVTISTNIELMNDVGPMNERLPRMENM